MTGVGRYCSMSIEYKDCLYEVGASKVCADKFDARYLKLRKRELKNIHFYCEDKLEEFIENAECFFGAEYVAKKKACISAMLMGTPCEYTDYSNCMMEAIAGNEACTESAPMLQEVFIDVAVDMVAYFSNCDLQTKKEKED